MAHNQNNDHDLFDMRHKPSQSTIDEEMFREDPINFRLFCYMIRLKAFQILHMILFLDFISIVLCLQHLIWFTLGHTTFIIYMLCLGSHFLVCVIATRKAQKLDGRTKVYTCLAKLWMVIRTISLTFDIAYTNYYLFEYSLDKNYYVVSLILVYCDIFYAIYSLTLSYWINLAIKRLISKGQMSESSVCDSKRDKHRFSFDENSLTDNDQIFSSKSQEIHKQSCNQDYYMKVVDDNGLNKRSSSSNHLDIHCNSAENKIGLVNWDKVKEVKKFGAF